MLVFDIYVLGLKSVLKYRVTWKKNYVVEGHTTQQRLRRVIIPYKN